MTNWTTDQLDSIGAADELELASLRADGTLRRPVTIWVVRVGDDLYVRPVKGRHGWFRGTQTRRSGRIHSGGVEQDVFFEDADPGLSDAIEAAYRAKYRRYPAAYVDAVLTPEARAGTLKLVPR